MLMSFDLKNLKEDYDELEKKYKIPSFKEMNEEFEIEKIDKKSDCLMRIVRKVMMEKIINSLNFLEIFLNPANAPRIYFGYLKSMSLDDKQIIEDMYGKIGELSLKSLSMEIGYDEKKEAEMVKEAFLLWNSLKPKFSKIIHNVRNPGQVNNKEKSYFG